ncbi:hypothetical protein Hanom_Chr01g00025431 [Helianthus anomalus]
MLSYQNKIEQQIWITDGPLMYHCVTSETTRSYPSPLGIMLIHQFKRKSSAGSGISEMKLGL